MPVGTVVHNIELQAGKGGQMVKSAGTSAQLMAKEGNYATLRLPSGEMRYVRIECRATMVQFLTLLTISSTLVKLVERDTWDGDLQLEVL